MLVVAKELGIFGKGVKIWSLCAMIFKSLFNANSVLFFGSMDFDSLKLYGAIFISDGAVNALYHASKQYYHNAIAYKCKDLKIRRVWHCLILTYYTYST